MLVNASKSVGLAGIASVDAIKKKLSPLCFRNFNKIKLTSPS